MRTFTDDQLRAIKRIVDFRGRKIHMKEFRAGMSLNSYWDSGSRDYFFYIHVPSLSLQSTVLQNGTPFDSMSLKTTELPANTILVEKTIIRGKTTSITIYS